MSHQNRKFNCPEKPEELIGQPIGMYHCPYCGMMLIAGFVHPQPSKDDPYYTDFYKED